MQRSRFLQLEAQLKLAGVRIEMAEKQFEQAKSNLAIAEKDLRDSEVFAPIDGIVSARYFEPGEAAGKDPVLKIVDPSVLEVSIHLPEQYYDRVLIGQTPMRIAAEGVQLENREIVYKSPTVRADLRTFEVKCLIENPPAALVAGRMVQTETILAAHEGVGVPVDAIKQMRSGPVVFTVRAGRASPIPVKTGLQTDGWIEILDCGLSAGTPIVSVGQDFLDEGFAVSVVKES
jgi:RND family efflux transporter MFP subunit